MLDYSSKSSDLQLTGYRSIY